MYDEVIKKLLKKLDIIPEPLLALYLMKVYKLSENMAHQAVYAACRNRTCYKVNGNNIARTSFVEMNSNYMKVAKAFRVLLEFMPGTRTLWSQRIRGCWLLVMVKTSSKSALLSGIWNW